MYTASSRDEPRALHNGSYGLIISSSSASALQSYATLKVCLYPVNMPDPIRKRFGYGQLWPLRPECSQNRPGSYMPYSTSRNHFSSVFPKKAPIILCKTDQGPIWMAWSESGQTHLVWSESGQTHLVWSESGQTHLVWSESGQTHLVWSESGQTHLAWSEFGQTHLVWEQAGVQESPGPVSGRTQPAHYQFPTFRLGFVIPQTYRILLCKTSPGPI